MKKTCSKCSQQLEEVSFYKHKGWRDGYHPYCRRCFNDYGKARREKSLVNNPPRFRWKRDLVRHNYFHTVDTPLASYILGFLAADGNVLAKVSRVSIELSEKDSELLEMIRDELVPGGNIVTRYRAGKGYKILAFVSREMVNDLAEYNITPVKSLTLKWPELLPSSLEKYFILGFFDGDGSITFRKNSSYPYLAFTCGSLNFLKSLQEKILFHTGIKMPGPWVKKHGSTYTLRSAGARALSISLWLQEGGLGLSRKRLM